MTEARQMDRQKIYRWMDGQTFKSQYIFSVFFLLTLLYHSSAYNLEAPNNQSDWTDTAEHGICQRSPFAFTAPWQARVVITIAILTAATEIIQTQALQITVIPPTQSPRSQHSLRFLAQKEQVSILSISLTHTDAGKSAHCKAIGSFLVAQWRH